ncbi:hypothetical protein FB446DRAFT_786704 [Lentinula raphanica]|nr:hypothetical protein FB446DRAFT_786704 [Lentinula raphanica]
MSQLPTWLGSDNRFDTDSNVQQVTLPAVHPTVSGSKDDFLNIGNTAIHHPSTRSHWAPSNAECSIAPGVMEDLENLMQSTSNDWKETKEILWMLYRKAETVSERQAISFAGAIIGTQQVLETLNESSASSTPLKKIVRERVKIYLLSPTTTSYIKSNPDIINDLCTYGVRGTEDEGKLRKELSEAFVQERARIKSEVAKVAITRSHESGDDRKLSDVGTLAQILVGKTKGIPITLALIQRLALIRKIIDDGSAVNNIAPRNFWPLVDDEIAKLMGFDSEMPKTLQEVEIGWNELLREDIRKYGMPQGVQFTVY